MTSDKAIIEMAVDSLVCRPQARTASGLDDESIAGLAQSIAELGRIYKPLLVWRDGEALIVLDGERRLRAARKLRWATVPVVIEERELSPAEVEHASLVLDAQHVSHNQMERARSIDRLMQQTGWSAAQTAVKLGLSPANVSKLRALLLLPPDIQEKVATGRVAMSTAYELAKIGDAGERERLTAELVDGRLSRERMLARTKQLTGKTPAVASRRRSRRERVVIPLGDGRTVSLSAPRLSVESVAAWLGELAERMRMAASGGRGFEEFVKGPAKKAG